MNQFSVGIDIGTTTVSAVVLNALSGEIVDSMTLPNDSAMTSTASWEKTQDVHRIFAITDGILDDILKAYSGVVSLGITGQMHGILYLDGSGGILSPLYTWQDQRSVSVCETMEQLTGYRLSPGYGLATHAANLSMGMIPEKAVQLCTVMDALAMHLTGRKTPLTHCSNAAGLGLYRTGEGMFDLFALRQCGMEPDILPDVTERCEIVGSFRGIPVSVAIGDNQASFFGSVKEDSRLALANFGTGSQISVLCSAPFDGGKDPALECRPYLENSWLASGSALCGGRAYAILERFFRSYAVSCGLADQEQYEIMNHLAAEHSADENPLTVCTAFCGKRGNPDLRGQVANISEDNLTPGNLIAGVLRGMAEELYGLYEKMPHEGVDTLIVSGNAARKNPALRKTLEKVFGMEVLMPVHREEAAVGCALFGAQAAGVKLPPDTIRYTKE